MNALLQHIAGIVVPLLTTWLAARLKAHYDDRARNRSSAAPSAPTTAPLHAIPPWREPMTNPNPTPPPNDGKPVSEIGRNLLPIASAVGAVLSAALPLLDMVGVTLPDVLPDKVAGLLGSVFLLVTLIYSKLRTTPLVDPRDAKGTQLVPVDQTRQPNRNWFQP